MRLRLRLGVGASGLLKDLLDLIDLSDGKQRFLLYRNRQRWSCRQSGNWTIRERCNLGGLHRRRETRRRREGGNSHWGGFSGGYGT